MTSKIELRVLDQNLLDYGFDPATAGSAAIDLRVCSSTSIQLNPSGEIKVGSGIALALPPGLAAVVLPRSGLGVEGLVISNLIGLIDSDYRGEIFLSLWNRSKTTRFTIEPYQRVAQLMIIAYERPQFNYVSQFTDITVRGEQGGGSTGLD